MKAIMQRLLALIKMARRQGHEELAQALSLEYNKLVIKERKTK